MIKTHVSYLIACQIWLCHKYHYIYNIRQSKSYIFFSNVFYFRLEEYNLKNKHWCFVFHHFCLFHGPVYLLELTIIISLIYTGKHFFTMKTTYLHWNHLLTLETTYLHWKPLIYTRNHLFTLETTYLHWKPFVYIVIHLFTLNTTCLHWKPLIYTGNHLFTLETTYLHWKPLAYIRNTYLH